MTQETRVYPLDPTMTQEEMAVTFAMTSRSPEPFDQIATRVTADKSAEFHERWVLGYGHSSVAEHAVLHVAVENISRVACDALEDNRLASYTEKSSRYQVISKGSFRTPPELHSSPEAQEVFENTCNALFSHYQALLDRTREYLQDSQPPLEDETAQAYRLRLRRQATDACRSVLPAAILTNVGVTANARTMSNMVSKLLSSRLQEARSLGEMLLAEGRRTVPTLLKHAGASEHLRRTQDQAVWQVPLAQEGPGEPDQFQEPARLLDWDRNPAAHVLHAILYGGLALSAREVNAQVHGMTPAEQLALIGQEMQHMSDHDSAIREFEFVNLTMELLLDYGAYREFRRHRMQSVQPQPLTMRLGYRTPTLIQEARLGQEFGQAIQAAEQGCRKVAETSLDAAQYLVTHAHQRRLLVRMNLREAYHLFKLRTSQLAHESIRGPMLEAMRQTDLAMPGMLQWLKLRDQPDWWPYGKTE